MDDIGASVTDDCTDLAAHGQGDQDAGGRLYDRHAPLVFSLCRAETGARSREDAEDATQETFLRAFRMLDRLDDCRGFRPWLYAIARLVCKERRTSRARSRRDSAYAVGLDRSASRQVGERKDRFMSSEATGAAIHAAAEGPSQPLERQETLARLGQAIEELPDDVRLALHLFYIEQDPVTAAKRALGVSRAQFYRLVSQARELIGAKLSREDLQS